jgi:hypothetical protein
VNVPSGHAPSTEREKLVFDNSSWLQYADYDPIERRLEVGFKSGKVVEHWPVEQQTWIDWKAAPSKGSFYSATIKKFVEAEDIKK